MSRRCAECNSFVDLLKPGRIPAYCSDACRVKAYRARAKQREEERLASPQAEEQDPDALMPANAVGISITMPHFEHEEVQTAVGPRKIGPTALCARQKAWTDALQATVHEVLPEGRVVRQDTRTDHFGCSEDGVIIWTREDEMADRDAVRQHLYDAGYYVTSIEYSYVPAMA